MKWDTTENLLKWREMADAQERVYRTWTFVVESGHHFSRKLNMAFIKLYNQRKAAADAFFAAHCTIR